ncbi:MAG: hypothetical protein CME64_17085 [Halobacteriovoraceae bacterium]|nr:hypothetical protein [Halobacteriovoraceae bacterium]|tara:strand:+ start:241795 stop:242007 length:213 start_codon:yes stop_codon:yes gene_type:complete
MAKSKKTESAGKTFEFGSLGRILIENLEEVESSNFEYLNPKTVEDLTDLNAYAIQSGCSACSASGLAFCC